jgi:hypothetical protein
LSPYGLCYTSKLKDVYHLVVAKGGGINDRACHVVHLAEVSEEAREVLAIDPFAFL